ncbi:MAG: UxaA family hydrolase [Lachnospiraceae bacterium]
MNREQKQTAFQIHPSDNVATALGALEAGRVTITGEACAPEILAAEPISDGHKIALKDIEAGMPIVKYGVPIGTATVNIAAGSWVHLHCMRSNYDERSAHLDLMTGVPVDSEYE